MYISDPDVPQSLTRVSTSDSTTLVVTWSAPADSAASTYKVTVAGVDSSKITIDSGARKATISHLTAGTQYTVDVVAVLDGRDSESTSKAFYTSRYQVLCMKVMKWVHSLTELIFIIY